MNYDDIYCTKCRYKVIDCFNYNMEDGETLEITCCNCEHVFNLHCEIIISYATSEIKNK